MSKPFQYFYWVTAILFFTYVVLCAVYVPFTVDEAWTHEEFIKGNFWDVVGYYHPVANNHLLNSLLAKPFHAISDSEVSLRMPNVLAYLLYLFASFKITQHVTANKYLQLCLFLALNCNITLLHFFALCRGYGLSIALLIYSIYQLFNYIRQPQLNFAHACLLSAVLATYASFVTLFATTAIFMLIVVATIRHYEQIKDSILRRNVLIIVVLYVILALELCLRPIVLSIKWEQYYWGGVRNFFDDTLLSIAQDIVGYDIGADYSALWLPLIVVAIVGPAVLCVMLLIKRRLFKVYHVVASFILIWCIVAINVQFYILDSPLVIHRTALYLYPLIILSVFSLLSVLYNRYGKSYLVGGVISSVLFIFCIVQLRFKPVHEWWFDADNKKLLKDIIALPSPDNRRIRLLAYKFSSNSLNYYVRRKYRDRLEDVPDIGLPASAQFKNYDYLYLETEDKKVIPMSSFDIVRYYCDGKLTLYKNRNF